MAGEHPRRHPVPRDVLDRFSELGRDESTVTVLRHARIAERIGLLPTDHKAFELVRRHGASMTAGRIAELIGLSTGAVTGVIDRLERSGFVRRVRDPHDRRKVLVEIVEFDESAMRPLFESAVDLTEEVLAEFTPAERDVVERFLRRRLELAEADAFGEAQP